MQVTFNDQFLELNGGLVSVHYFIKTKYKKKEHSELTT